MAGQIFYRERRKVIDGEKKLRFRVVAVANCNLKVFADHLRISELKAIAEAVDAELVLLPKGPKHQKAA